MLLMFFIVLQILLCEKKGQFDIRSYIFPNESVDHNKPLDEFMVPPDTIERASGMVYFADLIMKISTRVFLNIF